MSIDLSLLSGEQLLMMSILGTIDQAAADSELDRRALLTGPATMEESISSLLSEHYGETMQAEPLGHAA